MRFDSVLAERPNRRRMLAGSVTALLLAGTLAFGTPALAQDDDATAGENEGTTVEVGSTDDSAEMGAVADDAATDDAAADTAVAAEGAPADAPAEAAPATGAAAPNALPSTGVGEAGDVSLPLIGLAAAGAVAAGAVAVRRARPDGRHI